MYVGAEGGYHESKEMAGPPLIQRQRPECQPLLVERLGFRHRCGANYPWASILSTTGLRGESRGIFQPSHFTFSPGRRRDRIQLRSKAKEPQD